MKAEEYLKSKNMIDYGCTEFIIKGNFGEVNLGHLLDEFAEKQNKDMINFIQGNLNDAYENQFVIKEFVEEGVEILNKLK